MQKLEDIFCCKDELVLFFYEQRVMQKALEKISALGFETSLQEDAIIIKLNEAAEDIAKICKEAGWSAAEQEGITAMLKNSKEPLSFLDIRSVKPLSQIVAILESSEVTAIIREKSFTTYFQPITELPTGEIYGYEALLRGVKSDGTTIPPGLLLDTTRRGDMIFYLDRAARETALKAAALKRIEKKAFINFLPTAIYNPENCLLDTVR